MKILIPRPLQPDIEIETDNYTLLPSKIYVILRKDYSIVEMTKDTKISDGISFFRTDKSGKVITFEQVGERFKYQ